MPTTEHKSELQQELHRRRDELAQLRDEIRLQIHLGEMEAKQRWKELEPKVIDFEHRAADMTGETLEELRDLGHDLRDRLVRLRDRLRARAG